MGGISEKVECGMTIKHEKRQEQNAAMGRRDHKRWMQCSLRKHGKCFIQDSIVPPRQKVT